MSQFYLQVVILTRYGWVGFDITTNQKKKSLLQTSLKLNKTLIFFFLELN